MSTRGVVGGVTVRLLLNDMVITEVSVSGWLALTAERVSCVPSVRVDQVDGVAARAQGQEVVDETAVSQMLPKTSSSSSSLSSPSSATTPANATAPHKNHLALFTVRKGTGIDVARPHTCLDDVGLQ